jgi:hypothetical protein
MSQRCKDCGAPIVWALTSNGRRMPVNPAVEGDQQANLILERHENETRVRVVPPGQGVHRPHHSTCPNANRRRKTHERTRH